LSDPFLPTKDHVSSNWTSHVRGGKRHEFVMSVVGLLSGGAGQSDDGVAVDADEASGLADAIALGQVLRDGDGRRLGEVRAIQGRALAPGEAVTTGTAGELAELLGLTIAAADGVHLHLPRRHPQDRIRASRRGFLRAFAPQE
jgi:hypothetical protein